MNPETRASLRRAWGMCERHAFGFVAVEAAFRSRFLRVKHLAGALAADPPPATRALLVEVESARLAVLGWELEEARRKSAWQFRPEQRGAEQTAWRRALLRCAGSLRDRMQ